MGDFWQHQAGWPRDTPEMVFLGRAVDQVGRVLFREEWTGKEPWIEVLSYFKIAIDRRATNNFIARHLPQFRRREYHGSMAPPPTGHDDHRPKFEFSKEERQEMKLFIDRHNATVPPAKERFKKVQNTIADGAVAGKFGTSFRALAGGNFCPIPSHWWSTERLEFRFVSCSINPEGPFEKGGAAYIFVSRQDFEPVIAKPPSEREAPGKRRGRSLRYDWEDAEQFAIETLNHNGDFDIPANRSKGWGSQNDLVGKLQLYMASPRGGRKAPSDSLAKTHVAKWVAAWRKSGQ